MLRLAHEKEDEAPQTLRAGAGAGKCCGPEDTGGDRFTLRRVGVIERERFKGGLDGKS